MLNGVAFAGKDAETSETPKLVNGLGIAPRRVMTLPASEEVVKALGLKKGIRVLAAELSGL